MSIGQIILFADEPTGILDTATGANVIELLFGLNEEEGTTLVLVTHDNSLADRCQRKFTMTAGQLEEALLNHPLPLLLGYCFVTGEVGSSVFFLARYY